MSSLCPLEIPQGYYAHRAGRRWELVPCDFWDADGRLIRVGDPTHPATVIWS